MKIKFYIGYIEIKKAKKFPYGLYFKIQFYGKMYYNAKARMDKLRREMKELCKNKKAK